MTDEPTGWRRVRRWLHLGPTRAELVAEAQVWQARCARSNAETREAYVRAKAAEKRLRQEEVRSRELEDKISAIMVARLNEPDRVEGCTKVRFHQQQEADDWAVGLAGRTGERPELYRVYQCKICPRSPVTMLRYWHAGHRGSEEAQAAKAASIRRTGEQVAAARRDGKLLEQRVDPSVLARLRKIGEGE